MLDQKWSFCASYELSVLLTAEKHFLLLALLALLTFCVWYLISNLGSLYTLAVGTFVNG